MQKVLNLIKKFSSAREVCINNDEICIKSDEFCVDMMNFVSKMMKVPPGEG